MYIPLVIRVATPNPEGIDTFQCMSALACLSNFCLFWKNGGWVASILFNFILNYWICVVLTKPLTILL